MKDFFEGIQSLFVDFLFAPYDFFRFIENWWASNMVNWVFVIIGTVAMVYWVLQLKSFDDNNEENKDVSAHSFL